jgi:hypothetical protein
MAESFHLSFSNSGLNLIRHEAMPASNWDISISAAGSSYPNLYLLAGLHGSGCNFAGPAFPTFGWKMIYFKNRQFREKS